MLINNDAMNSKNEIDFIGGAVGKTGMINVIQIYLAC